MTAREVMREATVDRNGVNAFFVDPTCFDSDFLNGVSGLDFAENQYQLNKFGGTHERQFDLISAMPLVEL